MSRTDHPESPGAGRKLPPCPASPNCVSSDASGTHYIAPIAIRGSAEQAWQALIRYLESDRAFTVVEQQPDYIRAEARTRLLRFVDDVEFVLRPERREIAMRSASRVGYSDLGANRKRLERVRRALQLTPALGSPEGSDQR